jgi:hypothetical protein
MSAAQILIPPALVGFLGGLLSNFLFQTWSKWQEKRQFSLLGVSIIDSLLEESQAGLHVLQALSQGPFLPGDPSFLMLMPHASWYGMETIPNEVLLRIVSVEQKSQSGLPISEIRTHCKNYFTNICGNVNTTMTHIAEGKPPPPTLQQMASSYLSDTQRVADMLSRAKALLNQNARKKWWPR